MGENRLMADLYEENQRLKARIEELEKKHWNECRQVAHYDDELRGAKELLKAAVEDFTAIAEVHAAATPILCPQYGKYMKAIDVRTRKWQYADEALALIGGLKMTLDEAIKHCLEVAEQNDTQAEKWQEEGGEKWGKTTACRECAAEHRQLAEWLTELKEAKRLLKAAVEDIRYCMYSYDPCEVCDLLKENGECAAADDDDCNEKHKWRYEAEALALIGEDTNVGGKTEGR